MTRRPGHERRTFIRALGGAAAWPLAARAQQGERARRIAVLSATAGNDPETLIRFTVFRQGLQELGWVEGSNLLIEYRWGAGDVNRMQAQAAELSALAPELILAQGTPVLAALKRATTTIPIVFVIVTIRWPRASFRASRDPAATSPASALSTTRSSGNRPIC
jgi:ABC-type uncharacterized transport system substrate-binding protein